MSDEYAPFPESELEALAEVHEDVAKTWKAETTAGRAAKRRHLAFAKTCRDAIASHVALRERMLIAEMDNRQAKAS